MFKPILPLCPNREHMHGIDGCPATVSRHFYMSQYRLRAT